MKQVSMKAPRTISFSEKPIGRGRRRLADWINLTGEKKVHSLVHKLGTVTGEPTLGTGHSRLSETNTFFEPPLGKLVKAVCGKTARTVWAADGGEPLNGRLLRLDTCDASNDCGGKDPRHYEPRTGNTGEGRQSPLSCSNETKEGNLETETLATELDEGSRCELRGQSLGE